MKKLIIILLLSLSFLSVSAQRILRTEFVTYDTREDSRVGNRTNTTHYIKYTPSPSGSVEMYEIVGEMIDIPVSWGDYNVYLHVENTIKSYIVCVNGEVVASVDDAYTPADFFISPYLTQGENAISLLLHRADAPELNDGAKGSLGGQFEGSYIFAQHKLHIYDYSAHILTAENGKDAMLYLDIVARNSFNYTETINIGYDIYSPDGKLLDYAVREMEIAGRGCDTLHVETNLGDGTRFRWGHGKAPLYNITLYVKRDGKPREYIPFSIGYGETTFADGKIFRNGKQIELRTSNFDARSTRKEAVAEIRSLKKQGVNTLMPSCPQPMWFYDICDKEGMYVVEGVNINPTVSPNDRNVGGTPSNNPNLMGEYVARVDGAYFRTRNRTCIIAYRLGNARSGNGCAMYEAYRHFKSLGDKRPAYCPSADGEWNTDINRM